MSQSHSQPRGFLGSIIHLFAIPIALMKIGLLAILLVSGISLVSVVYVIAVIAYAINSL